MYRSKEPEFGISHRLRLCGHLVTVVDEGSIEVRWKLLGDHPLSVVHLQQITNLIAGISSSAMPDLAAKNHYVTCAAKNTHFLPPLLFVFIVGRTTRSMAARHKVGWAQFLIHVVQVVMNGSDEDRDSDARISGNIFR